jgi:hypothetical protein
MRTGLSRNWPRRAAAARGATREILPASPSPPCRPALRLSAALTDPSPIANLWPPFRVRLPSVDFAATFIQGLYYQST